MQWKIKQTCITVQCECVTLLDYYHSTVRKVNIMSSILASRILLFHFCLPSIVHYSPVLHSIHFRPESRTHGRPERRLQIRVDQPAGFMLFTIAPATAVLRKVSGMYTHLSLHPLFLQDSTTAGGTRRAKLRPKLETLTQTSTLSA